MDQRSSRIMMVATRTFLGSATKSSSLDLSKFHPNESLVFQLSVDLPWRHNAILIIVNNRHVMIYTAVSVEYFDWQRWEIIIVSN